MAYNDKRRTILRNRMSRNFEINDIRLQAEYKAYRQKMVTEPFLNFFKAIEKAKIEMEIFAKRAANLNEEDLNEDQSN